MKTYELLPPENITDQLKLRLEQLQMAAHQIEKTLQKVPVGRIRTNCTRKNVQYFLITEKGDTQGKYIPKNQLDIAAEICQYEYSQKKLLQLHSEQQLLAQLLKHYLSADAFSTFPAARQKLITPVTLPDKAYTAHWQTEEYPHKALDTNQHSYISNNGTQLRSKSELMIANALEHHKIPYKYEKPVALKDNILIHPDFTCLNLKTRREIIWEHFGMMDNADYAAKTAAKIKKLQASKIIPGKNIIFTMETSQNPLTSFEIETIIKEYFL